MSAVKKSVRPKNFSTSNTNHTVESAPLPPSRLRSVVTFFRTPVGWVRSLRSGSPHSSFRRTRRRDYIRSLDLPGYLAFTIEVWRTLWQHKVTFGLLIATYALFSGLLVGFASQSTYSQIGEVLRTTGGDTFEGKFSKLWEAGLLLVTGVSGSLNPVVSEVQQLIAGILILMAWLTTVWLLRAYMAGRRPGLRDGLYNAGAPIVPSFILGLLLIVQLIPAAVVAIGISAAIPTGLLNQGVEAMLFWTVALLLTVLSLYWISSTMIALVVVTLPGMYPMQAMKTAGELVIGRRLRILLRLIWMLAVSLLLFVIVMIPMILFDAWLKGLIPQLDWLPLVPLGLLFVSSFSVVFTASYVYLLYRKVVDNESTSD